MFREIPKEKSVKWIKTIIDIHQSINSKYGGKNFLVKRMNLILRILICLLDNKTTLLCSRQNRWLGLPT